MARTTQRHRRSISPRHLWILKLGGFRYSASRNAYVLRGIGNRFGPVYRASEDAPSAEDASPPSAAGTTRAA